MTPSHNNPQEEFENSVPNTPVDDIDENLNYICHQDGKHRHRRHKSKTSKAQKIILIILFSIISLILALVSAFLIMSAIGKEQMVINDDAQISVPEVNNKIDAEENGKIITHKGKTYKLNENMTTILCMGIDKSDINATDGFGANGQADANFLLAIDTKSGKTTAININRDTMIDVNVYSDGGDFAGAKKQQLCLAFANGDGKHKSVENMIKSVSNVFYGIPISSYIAMDLSAIGPLNTAVGGVTVTPPESFEYAGYYYENGKPMQLTTESAALGFIRYRDVTKLDSNQNRNVRQRIYLQSFADAAISKTKQQITFPVTLYNLINDYNINNLNVAKITFLTSVIMGSENGASVEFLDVEGDLKRGDNGAEFTPNADQLFEMILKVYYVEN